ncbi:hypothetical protein ACP4OV_013421 [Aristida adscensionis]
MRGRRRQRRPPPSSPCNCCGTTRSLAPCSPTWPPASSSGSSTCSPTSSPMISRWRFSGRLQLLYLNGNRLTGELPNINMPLLKSLNVSFNNLTGEIPKSFGGMPAASFLGMALCGKPLPTCQGSNSEPPSQPPAPPPEAAIPAGSGGRGPRHLTGGAIIVIGCEFGFLLVDAVLVLACGAMRCKPRTYRRHDAITAELALHSKDAMSPNTAMYTPRVSDARAGPPPPPPPSLPPVAVPTPVGRKKLFFFGRVPWPYDLEDLRCARPPRSSACYRKTEQTCCHRSGKGTYGTTYKAATESGLVMEVKRLKETSLLECEFREKVGGGVGASACDVRAHGGARGGMVPGKVFLKSGTNDPNADKLEDLVHYMD